MFKNIKNDIRVIKERDPAASSTLEVLLCYPGFWAIFWHRFAHYLYKHNLKLLARITSNRNRKKNGIEIHPAAKIGKGVFIDHGMGVVIGETSEIGDNVTIYQGATIGGTGKDHGKRHPTIGDNVVISSGAKILGPFTVGENSKIGAGSVVLREVPPNSTVVGVPGRVVSKNGVKTTEDKKKADCSEQSIFVVNNTYVNNVTQISTEYDLDQINLPDPIFAALVEMNERLIELESEVKKLKLEREK